MKVFISWSGPESKQIAEIFKTWLKSVIQSTEPWISVDIEKGESWDPKISEELKNSPVGILCLTPNNLNKSWLLFEAGAIYSNDNSKVCTVLWKLKPADVKPPLDKFQHTEIKKEEIFKLIKTINGQLPENKLSDEDLKNIFDVWWPKLEEKLKQVSFTDENEAEIRSDRDILEEILDNTRIIQNRTERRNQIELRKIKNIDSSPYEVKPEGQKLSSYGVIYDEKCPRCPACQSSNINISMSLDKISLTTVYKCNECGTIFCND